MYIDTHCHLNFPELYKNRKAVIERAISAGIEKIITIGTDIESSTLKLPKNFLKFMQLPAFILPIC